MTMLAGLMGARHAIKVGTFTCYSSICLARGMAEGGRLICCDISEEWTSLARSYWQKAGLADRVDIRTMHLTGPNGGGDLGGEGWTRRRCLSCRTVSPGKQFTPVRGAATVAPLA
jgi:tRNA A58 N-methylase Trm61